MSRRDSIKRGVGRVTGRTPGRGRVLPDYLILGAPRAGTTSVHGWLCEHPRVVPTAKEILFFNVHWREGVDAYRARFPLRSERDAFEREHGRPFVTGDATASYLLHRWTPERAAAVVPDARLIVCLRDPVDRALSQYHAARRIGQEPLESFEEALAAEPGRLAADAPREQSDPDYFSRAFHVWAYTTGGVYAEQLERWFSCFPREAFLLLNFDGELVPNPQAAIARVHSHLGLEPHQNLELPTLNMNAVTYTDIAADTRERLTAQFREPNRRLAELTGVEFGWAA